MKYIKVDYYKTLALSTVFCFVGFFCNAQYIVMGSCCTVIDKPPKFAYVITDYTNLKGIVDTTLFGDKVYKRVCVVSPESFQILLNYLHRNAQNKEKINRKRWCRYISLAESCGWEDFICTNDYYAYGRYAQDLKDFLRGSEMDKKDSRLIIDNFP
jgi:hypothetical protein